MGLLELAWKSGFTVKSDFARRHAELVAMAASLQLVSTRTNRHRFSREWRITGKGLRWLNESKELE